MSKPESEMESLIARVENEICEVESKISELESKISNVEDEIRETHDSEEKRQLREEKRQLREKEGQLREEKRQLREKEGQLREKERRLEEKEHSAGEPPLKKVRYSASDIGTTSSWDKRRPELNVFCHRPPECSATHTSLYYKPFSTFMDRVQLEYTHECEYGHLAAELSLEMSRTFRVEARRVESFRRILGKLPCFSSTHVAPIHLAPLATEDGSRTDLTVYIQHNKRDHYLANFEVKNELGHTQRCGVFENIGYYLHLNLTAGGLQPMLLVTVVGCHYVQAFGAISVDSQVFVDPLSDPISLLFVTSTSGIEKVAQFLRAMSQLVLDLKEHYETPQPESHDQFPYFNEGLTYEKTIKPGLFKGTYEKKPALIKFCKQYGDKVHKCLADECLAPSLFLFKQLDARFKVVVMEYIDGTDLFKLDDNELVNLSNTLSKVLEVLKKNKLVHGDLRPPNVIKKGSRFYVVDFDWSQEEGKGYYPLTINTDLQWVEGVAAGCKLMCAHDQRMVEKLIEDVR